VVKYLTERVSSSP